MLYKRSKSPFLWTRFQLGGREFRLSTGTRNRREAEEFETEARSRAWRQIKLKEQPPVPWKAARKRWLAETEKRTKAQDESILDWFDQHLAGKTLAHVTLEVINELRALRAEETSKSTANRYMALLRAILRKAHREWGMLAVLPTVPMYALGVKEPRWLSKLEAIKLRRALRKTAPHIRDMAIASLYTGLRMRNITGLTWDRVDLRRGTLWVPASAAKGNKSIGLPLHARAWAVIRGQKGRHPKFVFTYSVPQKKDSKKIVRRPVLDCNTRAFKEAVERAGVGPLRWHDLRHTFASWHAQGGTPFNVLQELGAWASYEMVRRYAHLATDHLVEHARSFTRTKTGTVEK